MFTHTTQKDYIFKHTFNVPPLVPLVQYNFKQTIEEKKDIVFFVLLQIRGSHDTVHVCVCFISIRVFLLFLNIVSYYKNPLSLLYVLSLSLVCVCVLHFFYLVSFFYMLLCYYCYSVYFKMEK